MSTFRRQVAWAIVMYTPAAKEQVKQQEHSIRAGETVGDECYESHDSEPTYPLALQRIAATCVSVDGESFHEPFE